MSLPMISPSPVTGADARITVYSRLGNPIAIDIAITDDGVEPIESDTGWMRTDDVCMALDSIGESRDERITRGSGGDMRSCAVRLTTLRG